jgi:cytidine deaminase
MQLSTQILIIILFILLSAGLIVLIIYLAKDKNTNHLCTSGPGYKAAKSYFNNPNNKEKITITPQDFKPIVKACDGNIDRALLCIANCIAYEGVSINKGSRIPRIKPPPGVPHTVMSGYPVGACVLGGETGTVYIGANFEFCSRLINTVHGEQCAIHNAAVHGEPSITKLAVNAAPCGVCRQYLVEIGPPENLDVIFCDNNGKFVSYKLSNLIIESFGPENLGQSQTSLKHTPQQINIKNTDEPSVKEAKKMFKQAYSPYTNIPEGIVLEFKQGQIARGQTIENAAYNPSLSAFRGACSLAALKGYNMEDLSKIIYVHYNYEKSTSMAGAGKKCEFNNVGKSFKEIMKILSSSSTFPTDFNNIIEVKIPFNQPKSSMLQAFFHKPIQLPL